MARAGPVDGSMQCNDAMGAVAELAASQHGAFSRLQAVTLGLSSRRIQTMARAGLVDEPVRGVLRIRGAPITWHQRMMVATLVGSGFHAGFRAAAHLHGIDGCHRPPPIEVIGGPSRRRIGGLDVV